MRIRIIEDNDKEYKKLDNILYTKHHDNQKKLHKSIIKNDDSYKTPYYELLEKYEKMEIEWNH